MNAPNNPFAFPQDESDDTSYTQMRGGMTLRDYFAGQALIGIFSGRATYYTDGESFHRDVVKDAYAVADAMLAERGKAEATS